MSVSETLRTGHSAHLHMSVLVEQAGAVRAGLHVQRSVVAAHRVHGCPHRGQSVRRADSQVRQVLGMSNFTYCWKYNF